MRILVTTLALTLALTPGAFAAGGKSKTKSLTKICKTENPGASKKEVKKCVKEKMAAERASL